MGNAITGMHYTAMAAVSFWPTNQSMEQPSVDNFARVGIGIATLVILMLALIASLFDQRLSTETARAEAIRRRALPPLVQNASNIAVVADGTVSCHKFVRQTDFGYEPEDWLGKGF